MATLTCRAIPAGASVTVHAAAAKIDGAAPSGAALASGTVDSDGLLSITDSDITAGKTFLLYALVGSTHINLFARSTLDVFDAGGAIGTGDTTDEDNEIANASATSGEFRIGQRISGPGIPAGTFITNIVTTTLTLSADATATDTGVALVAEGAFTWSARLRRRKAALGTV